MKTKIGILTILLLGLCFAGCNKDSTLPEQTEQRKVYLYVNTFAFNRINQYYLWNEEVAAALKDWKTADEPIAKVQSVRYRDDRWTLLTDDVDSFYDSTTGHRKGFGFEVGMDLSAAQLIVLYTYAGSPAEEAGLKRGDAITSLNGSPIPTQDYSAFIKQALRNKDRVTLGMKSGATISLTARDMYENPVLLSKIFDCGGKKVGYLAYTSFTLDSYKDLISICKAFKQAGVSELILDLRYNGGGFVLAEQFFASMLAPEAEVKAKSVLSTEVYNSKLTAQYAKEGVDNRSYFTTEFKFSTTDGQKYDFRFRVGSLALRPVSLHGHHPGRSPDPREILHRLAFQGTGFLQGDGRRVAGKGRRPGRGQALHRELGPLPDVRPLRGQGRRDPLHAGRPDAGLRREGQSEKPLPPGRSAGGHAGPRARPVRLSDARARSPQPRIYRG